MCIHMDLANSIISAVLGFASGWMSSYIFWIKQRQLDRPRLELSHYERPDKRGYYIKNKGGSFAEHPRYRYGHYHRIGEPDDTREIFLDAALGPGDEQRIWPELEFGRDANIEVLYLDVFGKSYNDAWDVSFQREFPYEEFNIVVSKRYWPPDSGLSWYKKLRGLLRIRKLN